MREGLGSNLGLDISYLGGGFSGFPQSPPFQLIYHLPIRCCSLDTEIVVEYPAKKGKSQAHVKNKKHIRSNRTENTPPLHYRNQSANDLQGNNRGVMPN
jgi:hypothetical protein